MARIVWMVSSLTMGLMLIGLMFIILRYGSKKEHYLWAFFHLAVGSWGFGSFFVSLAQSSAEALLPWKVALLGAIICPTIFYNVVTTLGNIKRTKLLVVFYTFCFLFCLAVIFNVASFKPVYLFNSLYYIHANNLWYVVFMIGWIMIILYTVIELAQLYRRSVGERKIQFLYFLIGSLVGFTGGLMNGVTFFGINIFPLGNALICIYWAICTYAIFRHQLMDIEVIIRKTLVFAGLLASVFAILILPTLLVQEYIFRSASFGGRLIGLTISGVIIILTMRRIETFLVNVTDKYLFQKKYDYKELLRTFTTEVLTVVNLNELVNMTVDKLTNTVKVASSAVLLLDEEKQQFNVVAAHGVRDPEVTLIRPDGIVTFLEQTHGYLLKKDLIERKVFIPPSIQEIIDKLNAELIIPMVLHDEVMGILSLGKKKSDEDYTQDDLDILLPLARTLAIAISNAKLFDELGKTQAEAAQKEKMAVIGTLSAGINHEICNPLGIARGQCEAFLLNIKDGLYNDKTPDELLAKAKDIMAKVIKETDRATAITKKLSGFAKPAKGEAELVNIDKEVDDVLGLVSYELKLEKIEFEKQIGKDMPNILVDKKQFQEVLFNLIRNAGQAIGEKGKISVIAKEEGGKVIIDIKDTGSGIPEDKLKELFNPFFTTKEPGKGTGLGLFIVRQVVEKNGGRIYLKETKVGEGATFRIEFPLGLTQESRV